MFRNSSFPGNCFSLMNNHPFVLRGGVALVGHSLWTRYQRPSKVTNFRMRDFPKGTVLWTPLDAYSPLQNLAWTSRGQASLVTCSSVFFLFTCSLFYSEWPASTDNSYVIQSAKCIASVAEYGRGSKVQKNKRNSSKRWKKHTLIIEHLSCSTLHLPIPYILLRFG